MTLAPLAAGEQWWPAVYDAEGLPSEWWLVRGCGCLVRTAPYTPGVIPR